MDGDAVGRGQLCPFANHAGAGELKMDTIAICCWQRRARMTMICDFVTKKERHETS